MCEEFHCIPSVAELELRRNPDVVFEILRLRAYASAKRTYDAFDRMDRRERDRLNADPLIQLVQQTEFELMQRGPDE